MAGAFTVLPAALDRRPELPPIRLVAIEPETVVVELITPFRQDGVELEFIATPTADVGVVLPAVAMAVHSGSAFPAAEFRRIPHRQVIRLSADGTVLGDEAAPPGRLLTRMRGFLWHGDRLPWMWVLIAAPPETARPSYPLEKRWRAICDREQFRFVLLWGELHCSDQRQLTLLSRLWSHMPAEKSAALNSIVGGKGGPAC